MITPITLNQVDTAIAGVAGDTSYIRGMWHYALEQADKADDAVPLSENCDAIPYVPLSPEAYGVSLTPGSLVLDVGCLGGYGLYDFLWRRQRAGLPLPKGIGVDIDPVSIAVADALAPLWVAGDDVSFVRSGCEALPLADAAADLIVARLVLPYVRLRTAVAELSRVLKPGGVILVQTHAPRYYWRKMWQALPRVKQVVYSAKPIVNGAVLALTGLQVGRETALCSSETKRLLARHGLQCVWEGGFASKPMLMLRKEQ